MSKCIEDCNIEDKLNMCCKMHPETLEVIDVVTENGIRDACPNLSSEGKCFDYRNRPEICKIYECPTLAEKDVYTIIIDNS